MIEVVETQELKNVIDVAWDKRNEIDTQTSGRVRDAVETALNLLDTGKERVAEPKKGTTSNWHVNQWLKKAVLLSFRLNDMEIINNSAGVRGDAVPPKQS